MPRILGNGRGQRWLATGVLLALAGCGPAGPVSPTAAAPTAAAPTAASTAAPVLAAGLAAVAADPYAGIGGELLQFRRDVPARRLQVRLTAANAGLVVEELELRAPGLSQASDPARDSQLRERTALDLPVVLATSDCAVSPGQPVAALRLRDATGLSRTVEVPLDDDGLVQRLHEADCAEQAQR